MIHAGTNQPKANCSIVGNSKLHCRCEVKMFGSTQFWFAEFGDSFIENTGLEGGKVYEALQIYIETFKAHPSHQANEN